MDQIRLRLSIFLLVSVAFSVNTLAQDTRGWIGNGLGASLAGGGVGLSDRASVQLVFGNVGVSARASVNDGGASEYRGFFGRLRDEAFDAGATVGYAVQRPGGGYWIVGAGPSVVWGRRIIGAEEPPCFIRCAAEWEDYGPTAGVAIDAGMYAPFSKVFGYSIVLHASLNKEQSFVGLTFGVTVGKQRR